MYECNFNIIVAQINEPTLFHNFTFYFTLLYPQQYFSIFLKLTLNAIFTSYFEDFKV